MTNQEVIDRMASEIESLNTMLSLSYNKQRNQFAAILMQPFLEARIGGPPWDQNQSKEYAKEAAYYGVICANALIKELEK